MTTGDQLLRLPAQWVSESEARLIAKRTSRTLGRWRAQGQIRTRRVNRAWQYAAEDLRLNRKRTKAAYFNRPYKAGPGRGKKHPHRAAMADLLQAGVPAKDVALRFDSNVRTVGRVRRDFIFIPFTKE